MNTTVRRLLTWGALPVIAGGILWTGASASSLEVGDVESLLLARQMKIWDGQAERIALDAVPGTTRDVGMERTDGRVVYEVIVTPHSGESDVAVSIDAVSGEILKIDALQESGE